MVERSAQMSTLSRELSRSPLKTAFGQSSQPVGWRISSTHWRAHDGPSSAATGRHTPPPHKGHSRSTWHRWPGRLLPGHAGYLWHMRETDTGRQPRGENKEARPSERAGADSGAELSEWRRAARHMQSSKLCCKNAPWTKGKRGRAWWELQQRDSEHKKRAHRP